MPHTPKIIHIIPSLAIGGAEKLLLNTIKLLPGYEHHVVSFSGDPGFMDEFRAVSFVHVKRSVSVLGPVNFFYLKSIEQRVHPLIIHSHLLNTNWLSRLAFPRKTNLVNSIHSLYSVDAYRHHHHTLWMEKYTYQASRAALVFVSDKVKEDYARYVPLKRESFILENFVEKEFFSIQPLPYRAKDPLKLVAVGNVKPSKNYDLLIEAFKELKDYPISLDIYGRGDMIGDYRELALQNGLDIQFKGSVPSMSAVIGNYHALVFPSLYEGLSLTLLEAMAARVPLLLSRIPGFTGLALDNAQYFDPGNVGECREAILHLYQSGYAEQAVWSNQHLVREKYTEAIYKDKLLQIYGAVQA